MASVVASTPRRLICDHWPRLQGPTHRLVSGQTSKDGCKQSQGSSIHRCVQYIQYIHAIQELAYRCCNQSQSQHTRVFAIPQPLVCLQLMSDPRSNQLVFMQRPWGSARKQGNRQSDPRTSQCQGNDQTRTTNKQSRSGQQGSIFPLTG